MAIFCADIARLFYSLLKKLCDCKFLVLLLYHLQSDVCRGEKKAPSFVLVRSLAVVDNIEAPMHRWHNSNLIRGTMIRTTDILQLRTACKKNYLLVLAVSYHLHLPTPPRYHLLARATEWQSTPCRVAPRLFKKKTTTIRSTYQQLLFNIPWTTYYTYVFNYPLISLTIVLPITEHTVLLTASV